MAVQIHCSHGKVSHAVAVQYFFALLAQAYFWHLGKMAERENGPLSLSIVFALLQTDWAIR